MYGKVGFTVRLYLLQI